MEHPPPAANNRCLPHAQPHAASHLLGIADPEGDGVEMDEAALQGLKEKGKQG